LDTQQRHRLPPRPQFGKLHANPDSHAYTDTNAHAYTDTNSHDDTDSYTHAYAHTNSAIQHLLLEHWRLWKRRRLDQRSELEPNISAHSD